MSQSPKIAVVGAGVAGLVFSLELLRLCKGSIHITLFADSPTNNSAYAQGGLAISSPNAESISSHKIDTFLAGEFINDAQVVNRVVSNSYSALQTLLDHGVSFEGTSSGTQYHQEAGHSEARIVHRADSTGKELVGALGRKLLALGCVRHLRNTLVSEMKRSQSTSATNCGYRLTYIDSNDTSYREEFDYVYLCTGGLGGIYAYTTNSETAVGSGLSLARNAGATLRDLEFVQFHPTAIVSRERTRMQLATEALRGAGSVLVNQQHNRLRSKDGQFVEMLTRDKLARLVWEQTSIGQNRVYLDSRRIGQQQLKDQFPQFWQTCIDWNKDPSKEPIEVATAAHYSCGGVVVDAYGRSGIDGVYIGGELMSTGLHGANRLASNSLTEAVVYAKASAKHLSEHVSTSRLTNSERVLLGETSSAKNTTEECDAIMEELRACMSANIGVMQSNAQHDNASRVIQELQQRLQVLDNSELSPKVVVTTRFALQTADLVLKHARARELNIGTFYNIDLT